MEGSRTMHQWSNKELNQLKRYKQGLREKETNTLSRKILSHEQNDIRFYHIHAKEELPTYLQKQEFQSIHCNEKDVAKVVKIYHKENRSPLQKKVRKDLRNQGHLMILSEIYQHLDERPDNQRSNYQTGKAKSGQHSHFNSTCLEKEAIDFDQWEKTLKRRLHSKSQGKQEFKKTEKKRVSKLYDGWDNSDQKSLNYIKGDSDCKQEVEKALQIIKVTHSKEKNILNKFSLIEKSSKSLKSELDSKMSQIEEDILQDRKNLEQARIQHHRLFEEKTKLVSKSQHGGDEYKDQCGSKTLPTNLSFFAKIDWAQDMKLKNKEEVQQNQYKILSIKKKISKLEQSVIKGQQELKSTIQAEKTYYKISLKMGIDCRDNGLDWTLRYLLAEEKEIESIEFPTYMEKKSKQFLISKSKNQEELQQLLDQKKHFVQQIGKSFKISHKRLPFPLKDEAIEKNSLIQEKQIPKKYRKSIRKLSVLQQEFARNQGILQLNKYGHRVSELGKGLEGKTAKQIYHITMDRIKKLNFSKMKKKGLHQNFQLVDYQMLLQSIANIHVRIEQHEIQQENHLLSQYGGQREKCFMLASACFGSKKAYSLIIKHFSWKESELH